MMWKCGLHPEQGLVVIQSLNTSPERLCKLRNMVMSWMCLLSL